MLLISCKVELKLKWSNYCVLSGAGIDNANGNDDNIIFTIKNTKLYVPVVTLSARDNQKLTKLLSKGFIRSVYWNEFVKVNRLFIFVYSNDDVDCKRFKAKKYKLPKGIIKNYDVIINGKNFYDQTIDFDLKRFEEIRKLATG